MSHILDLKTGLSCSAFGKIDEEVMTSYAKAGIQCCEVSLANEQYDSLDWNALRKASENTGVELWSVHLPFSYTINLAHPEASFRHESMELFLRILDEAANAGVHHAVVHPSSEPISDDIRPSLMEYSVENCAVLARQAALRDMVICVEDLPRTCLGNCSEEMKELISGDPALRICFDVNHLLKESHKSFVDAVGDKIVTLHLSDYDFLDEKHLLPGEGKINWYELADLLEQIDYKGPFLFECGFLSVGRRSALPTYTPEVYRTIQDQIGKRIPMTGWKTAK